MIKETAFDKYSNIFIRIMFWIVIIIYIVFMGYTTTDAYRLEFAGHYLVEHQQLSYIFKRASRKHIEDIMMQLQCSTR